VFSGSFFLRLLTVNPLNRMMSHVRVAFPSPVLKERAKRSPGQVECQALRPRWFPRFKLVNAASPSIGDLFTFLQAVLAKVNVSRICAAGHSFGAATALLFSKSHAHHVWTITTFQNSNVVCLIPIESPLSSTHATPHASFPYPLLPCSRSLDVPCLSNVALCR
jgi:hypothetical protein